MRRNKAILIVFYICIVLFILTAVGPFFLILRTSLQETLTLTGQKNPEYTMLNYIKLITQSKFPRWMVNSIVFAGGVTVVKIFLDTFAGYAFARYKFPGGKFLFSLVLVTMMMPFAVAMFPVFIIVNKLRLTNTYFGLILPMLANPFGIFLMRQFILSIPKEIEESARIDGCSEIAILFKIVMPLSRPGQAVLAIIIFMWQWTNLVWPLIVTNTEDMFTLTVGLAGIPSQHTIDWGLLTAGAFFSVIPIIIFFLFYQRGFIEGLTWGAVKE